MPPWAKDASVGARLSNARNETVFTFGAEFVNFNALRPDATEEQKKAFLDSFLVPTRTLGPRAVRPGLRLDFRLAGLPTVTKT